MRKHKLIYVDDMTADKMKGIVKTRAKIIYNIETIDPKMADSFKEAIVEFRKGSLVLIAGRYICVVTMGLEQKGEGMLVINLDNNETGVKEMDKKFTNPKIKEKIKMAFEAIKNTPEGYYDFELELGELPVSA